MSLLQQLFVGNLSFEVTKNHLGQFFHDGGCDVLDVKVVMDHETKHSRGFAHVEMRNLPSLEKALTANGVEFMGRRLNVDVGKARPNDRRGGDRDRDRSGKHHSDDRDRAPLERGFKGKRIPGVTHFDSFI